MMKKINTSINDLKSVLDTIQSGVISINNDKFLIFYNDKAKRIFSLSKSFIGKPISGIVRNPKILILDDALSAVDASTEEEIRNELQNVMNKMTTLIITNRVPTIELCDEVLFIEDGKIRAQGKHEDILTEVKSYRSLFLEQQKASKLN